MPGTPPPGPRAKIARAKKHFADLANATVAITEADAQPYSVVVERQANGEVVFRVKDVVQVPPTLSCILGDFVHNLRSALDILVCDLARHNGADITTEHGFPICKDAHAFKSRFGGAIKKGSPTESVGEIAVV